MVRVFANGLGDLSSIPGQVIPKTQKMVLEATLFNTQHYKVWIKGKVEKSRERSSALPKQYTKVKLATIDEDNPKAPFSIATTSRLKVGRNPFLGLLHFILDPYLIMLSVKQGVIKYHFFSLWYD